uniref:cilia- and flagella-associated protein 47-like isoform X2 n=1 Tax=Styela clava TaxID=7725 RepID=UPI00193A6093|nr:cilia- and flagella-associated protein 47-like isoform X2 [Styela clava]
MDGDVAGIRIDPPIVEFVDAPVGEILTSDLKVQNVSKISKRIRFHAPVTSKFRLSVKNPTKPVAPGLEILATVEYVSDVAEDARDRVILAVNDDIVEIPLYAYMPTPLLDLEGPVDFGMVVANSKVLSQEVALINHGSMPGEFKISYNGDLPIVIVPTSGKVNPKTIQLIKVELVTENPCVVNEMAKVKLEGLQDSELQIKGCIVEQGLELLSREGISLKCVCFGPAYYGTDRIEQAILYNNGPEDIKWVSVLEEGADGEEAGTDLTKSTAATLATSPMERIRGKAYDILTSLVTVIPNQGRIGPYQKVPVFFRFSPRFNSSTVGWEACEKPPPRQDFALFMSFDMVGSNDSFLSPSKKSKRQVEIAVTATAVPVLVNIQPSNIFNFEEVPCGETSKAVCTLVNESTLLPLRVEFRKVAHFDVAPMQGIIPAGRSKDIFITFQPHQAGTFQPIQIIDVMGEILVDENMYDRTPKLFSRKFQDIPIQYVGTAVATLKKKTARLNPGITPLITNETGQFVDITFDKSNRHKSQTRVSMVKANTTGLHIHADEKNVGSAFIAFPNDRARSIRPSERSVEYRTPFTKTKRHTYVDSDYAFTEEEELKKKLHKEKYVQFLRNGADNRKANHYAKEFKTHNNNLDLGLKPAAGLQPPRLTSKDIESKRTKPNPAVSEKLRLLTTRQLANQERNTAARPVSDGLNAVPTTEYEKVDCRQQLTPQDLHKIIIGPPTIDFGQVCLRSTNMKQLSIINNLDQHIHVQVTIDCRELRQTSPLSQVVPPGSKAQLSLVFESSVEGRFQRSIVYTVNNQNESHILVLGTVVPVALELNSNKLELEPTPGMPAEAGYRSVVTLYNRRNYGAEFTWSPILTDRGTAFSVRPATGVVEAYKDLKCEVVFHPSYFAPLEGNFHLQVHNGNSMHLSCVAKLGAANVQFVERRIQFGSVPLNMRTVRTALLHNSGRNHALFYVVNSNPFPGMTVAPVHGVVPVGGNTELKVYLQPTAAMKFDTWIRVNIRGSKTIDLRMGGTVDPPAVDIDVKAFKFSGVYCNSTVTIPFNLINLTSTRVKADFDLSKHTDFVLSFPEEEVDDDPNDQLSLLPNTYSVELAGEQSLPCTLTFHPTSVASYDFNLPVTVNKTGAPSPSPSTFPPTPAPSEKHIVTPRPIIVTIATPRRRITATALRPLLHLSSCRLDFSLPVSFMDMPMPDHAVGDKKQILFANNTNSKLHWKLDIQRTKGLLEDSSFIFLKPGGAAYKAGEVEGTLDSEESYTLTILFCPRKAGSYSYKIPVILNGDERNPYRYLELNARIQTPMITFDPLALVLTPVPLATAVYAEFNIIATGYHRETKLNYSIPEVEAEDGSNIQCFSIEFPEGMTISEQNQSGTNMDENTLAILPCVLCFSSPKPVSACIDIQFTDSNNRKFVITVTATADNCLLTVYPFLAAHRNDHQIVCEQDKAIRGHAHDGNSGLGEAVILPCTSPHRPSTRGSTSATSSHFGASSSTYDDSSNSVSDSSISSTSYYCSCYTFPSFSTPASLSILSDNLSESDFVHSPREGAAQPVAIGSNNNNIENDVESLSRNKMQPSSQDPSRAGEDSQRAVQVSEVIQARSEPLAAARRDLVSRSLGSAAFPFDSSLEAHFHHEVLQSVQRWFSNYGWPGGPFPITVPHSLRSLITRMPYDDSETGPPSNKARHRPRPGASNKQARPVYTGCDVSSLRKDVKTIYDMLQHMCGRMVPGIPINQPLPRDPAERVLQLHWQHSTLLTFLRGQGASIAAIRPEFLFTPRDYRRWVKIREKEAKKESKESNKNDDLNSELKLAPEHVPGKQKLTPSMLHIEEELFESVSKRAWTDLLLQLIKVLVLSRVTPKHYRSIRSMEEGFSLPTVSSDPLASNVYSVGERIILAWMNHHYERQRHRVWGCFESSNESEKGGVPPSRWVVNFDFDLLDGLVIAAVVAAHCPWLIDRYFREMYTAPASPEQCLHNTLILVNALAQVGIDYDIQATDITDPNPIPLLLLCIHLYEHLPQYAPKSKVDFTGALHSIVHRQVRINNPSTKPLVYMVSVWGRDAKDFYLPIGDEITIPPRNEKNLDIEFASRFLRPAEAILVLVGRREAAFSGSETRGIGVGSTLVFDMETSIDDITPLDTIKCQTACYEPKKLDLKVMNPFPEGGNFKIILIESSDSLPTPIDVGRTHSVKSKKSTLSSRIKSVRSRTDHGQQKSGGDRRELGPVSQGNSSPDDDLTTLGGDIHVPGVRAGQGPRGLYHGRMAPQLTAFFCKESHIYLETERPTVLKLEYLPFRTGKKYCSILFSSDTVGEFIYAIESNATLPLPSPVPFNPNSPQSVRISSAAAAERGKGLFGGNEKIVYWKCETGTQLQETLLLPVTNEAKENALVIAAQQRMSDKEKERRLLTGTLNSGTVTANIAAMGLYNVADFQPRASTHPQSAPPLPLGTLFSVEASSDCFDVSATITLPSPMTFGPLPASEIKGSKYGPNDRQDDGAVPLKVKFKPRGPGHYPCDIILRSLDDIRVYRIECTVTPAGTMAHFEFRTPAHQTVTQNIPIQNASNHDWNLECKLQGEGFLGPSFLLARCETTTYYPLTFKPQFECNISGKLIIRNRSDGTEHVFLLRGIGERPLALAALEIQCQCRKTMNRSVDVPNYTQKKIIYKVLSDIPFLDGPSTVTVLAGQTATYTFTVCPWSRGEYIGTITFQGDNVESARQIKEDDSDSENEGESEDKIMKSDVIVASPMKINKSNDCDSSYRVWYTIMIDASPPPPEKKIEIVCPAQKSSVLEIPINNPTTDPITFNVSYNGQDLSGDKSLKIQPRIPATYRLTYSPQVVGEGSGSVVFQSDLTGEFWYELDLHAVSPSPVTIPRMECELGRWTRQYISVTNTTQKPMEITAELNNNLNFSLDMDVEEEQPVIRVPARSTADIPIQFMPTSLGGHNHEATVTLMSKELGKIVYWISGQGLVPKPMEPVSVSASVGSNTSLILPFRNPTDVGVYADVYLSDFDQTLNQVSDSVIRNNITMDSSFCLLLKHTSGIRLEPKQSIDIPFTFSPDKMRLYEGVLTIALRREDEKPWNNVNTGIGDLTGTSTLDDSREDFEKIRPLSRNNDGTIKAIRWVFPIHGIPEIRTKESKEAILHCQARSRIEERLEVTLTGAVPSSSSTHELARLRAVTPLDKLRETRTMMSEGVAVDGHMVAEEFSFSVDYPSEEVQHILEPALALSLVRKERDPHSGLVTLLFNVIFAPFKPFSHTVTLTVTSATGGVWRFPLMVKSSECPADDIITLEAAGLGKPSTVAFTLYSHSRHPAPFNAFFMQGSDPELTVSPQTGELLPQGSEGTKIHVTFTPSMYGKSYRARLLVQTLDMQWTYDVRGVTPEYKVPQAPSVVLSTLTQAASIRRTVAQRPRVNYVRKNIKITATGVSSPIKGGPLVVKTK